MATVKIRNVVLDEGLPKIAIPNVGRTREETISTAKEIIQAKPDLMEWRIDHFEVGINNFDTLKMVTQELRKAMEEIPILITFRTKNEDGVLLLPEERYSSLLNQIVISRLGDVVDIELLHDEDTVRRLVKVAHQYNITAVMSNHDFDKISSKDVIELRLKEMAELGADIPKSACMPHPSMDVLTLSMAITVVNETIPNPIITMAMGDLGKVGWIAGQVFGPNLPFGAVGQTFAPGQLTIPDLRNAEEYLELH